MFIQNLAFISLLMVHGVYGQKLPDRSVDSLKEQTYDALFDKIESPRSPSYLKEIYLKAFIDKAKSESNIKEIVEGYKNYVYHVSDKPSIVYTDSMVIASLTSGDNALIGSAYLTKGVVYYAHKDYPKALENYLVANEYILKTGDQYLTNKVKYNIAQIKNYTGDYEEAIALFEECAEFFKDKHKRAYLNTLHSIALCHNKMGNYGYSSDLCAQGILEGKRLLEFSMESYFIHLEGINHYFRENFAIAVEKIKFSLTTLHSNNDFANESIGCYYIGKSYLALKQVDLAIAYFRKVDEIFDVNGYIRIDLRDTYELLINHYEEAGDLNLKLYYINKLLEVDSSLKVDYSFLSNKIIKGYDTKALIRSKEEILMQLKRGKKISLYKTYGLVLLVVLLLIKTYVDIRNQRKYKQRFNDLMQVNKNELAVTSFKKEVNKAELDINQEAVEMLLRQLENFEKNKKYLEKDWTLVKLAAAFNSNTKYLSKVILHYRDKKFVEYINGLKVDYVIELLRSNKKARNYTNKALGVEAGFSSTQRFTAAFKMQTGISPTYFITELNNREGGLMTLF